MRDLHRNAASAILSITMVALTSGGVDADDTTRANCRTMAAATSKAADAMAGFSQSVGATTDSRKKLAALGRDVEAAATKVDEAQAALRAPFENFVNSLQDLAYQLQRCARN